MTLDEACKLYGLPKKLLQKYEQKGLLCADKGDYPAEQFAQLGLIETLSKAGFSYQEIKHYLVLARQNNCQQEQLHMLRHKRKALLQKLHEEQKVLDQVDFIIWKKNRY